MERESYERLHPNSSTPFLVKLIRLEEQAERELAWCTASMEAPDDAFRVGTEI